MPDVSSTRRPLFVILCGLAHAGSVVGWLPLLTVLLPIRIAALANDVRIGMLAAAVMAGGVTASLANIGFGWASDAAMRRGFGRRRFMAAGLVGLGGAYGGIAVAQTALGVFVGVIAFQVAINAVLAPFFALAAEEVPDAARGLYGALLALGQPIAAALVALMIALPGGSATEYLLAVPVIAALFCLPLLVSRRVPIVAAVAVPFAEAAPVSGHRGHFFLATGARLLVQTAGSVLSLYFYYYLQSISGPVPPLELAARVGTLLTIGYLIPLPLVLLIGQASDRIRRHRPWLVTSALVAAGGIAGMAVTGDPSRAIAAFYVFTTGSAVFLALHIGFALRLLPSAEHRGRDLGLYNLSNTLPTVIGPLLTWWLATPQDFSPLLGVMAMLAAAGGLMVLKVPLVGEAAGGELPAKPVRTKRPPTA